MKIRSLLHQVRWLPVLVKDILLKPTYRPSNFWERRHRGADDFWAVGSRGRDKEGNLAWYAQQEQDLLDEMQQLQLDLRQMSVLEIGSGRGYFTAIVQRLGCKEYLGIEIADSAVRRLRSKFPEFRFQTGDVSQIPLKADGT